MSSEPTDEQVDAALALPNVDAALWRCGEEGKRALVAEIIRAAGVSGSAGPHEAALRLIADSWRAPMVKRAEDVLPEVIRIAREALSPPHDNAPKDPTDPPIIKPWED